MVKVLTILGAYILNIFTSGSDLIFQKLQQTREYFYQATNQQISYDQEFKLRLQERNYQRCMELIRTAQATPTKKDFETVKMLTALETNPHRKAEGTTCTKFIYHSLVDRGIIIPDTKIKRGINKLIEETMRSMSGVQGQLLKAIEIDDDKETARLIDLGAQPTLEVNSMTPIQHAIACKSINSLKVLYDHGVQPTKDHLKSIQLFAYLTQSNNPSPSTASDQDLTFTRTTQAEGFKKEIEICTEIENLIKERLDWLRSKRRHH